MATIGTIKPSAEVFAKTMISAHGLANSVSVNGQSTQVIAEKVLKLATTNRNSETIGMLAQLYTILKSSEKLDVKRAAIHKLIITPLLYDGSAVSAINNIKTAGIPSLQKYGNTLSYRYMLKNVPINTLVALAATESRDYVAAGALLSNAKHNTWTKFGDDYSFSEAEYLAHLDDNLGSAVRSIDQNFTILGACAWFPKGPFPAGFGSPAAAPASTSTASTPATTKGVTTMSSTINAASINPAVKPLVDSMLAQSGLNLTIDKIIAEFEEKDKLAAALTAAEKMADETITKLRMQLKTQAAMPTTMTIQASSTIPGGKMDMVDAGTLFPSLGNLTMKVPHFTWDHAHPDVPVLNTDYIFRTEMLIKALRCLTTGENLWLQGHTGSGKTTFIEQVAARLGWPVARVAFDSNVDRSELVGRMQLDGDGKGGTLSRWLPGVIEKALTNGYIMLCDELDAGHPNALYTLQPVLEGKALTLLEDGGRVVPPAVMSRFAATGNTTGNGDPSGLYPACRILSAATLDRFATFVNVPYITADEEAKLISSSVPGVGKGLLSKLVKFGVEMRQAFVTGQTPVSYSPRRSVAFAREVMDLQALGFNEGQAVTAAFKSKLYDAASEEFRQRLTEIANAAFGGVDPTKTLA